MQLSHEVITATAETIHDTGSHLFWATQPNESLHDSIQNIGQTAPVIVQQTAQGLELIAGAQRVAVLRKLDLPILARLVTDITDTEKGLLYLEDNVHRPLDDGMRLAALRYFQSVTDEKTLQTTILPRLGIKAKSKNAKLLLAWLKQDAIWQDHLIANRVPLAAGTTLAHMSTEDLSAVEPLFAHYSWSRSNAVNLLTWIFEASQMQACSATQILEQSDALAICKQHLSPKDTITRLLAAVKACRYPELSTLQETFTTTTREITAGTRWRIEQPNNFETGGAELTIQIKTPDQLTTAASDLQSLAGLEAWQKLWNLGGGNG